MWMALRGCFDLFLQGGGEVVKRGTMVLNGMVLPRQFLWGFILLPFSSAFWKLQRAVGPMKNAFFTPRFCTISSKSTTVPDRYWWLLCGQLNTGHAVSRTAIRLKFAFQSFDYHTMAGLPLVLVG